MLNSIVVKDYIAQAASQNPTKVKLISCSLALMCSVDQNIAAHHHGCAVEFRGSPTLGKVQICVPA